MAQIDETKIIDREVETGAFQRILALESARRVLVITARAGNGNTDVLRKIRLQCETAEVPVAMLSIESFENRPDEFAMVSELHKSFKNSGASLQAFEELNRARALSNTTAFYEKLRSTGYLNLENADISGSPKFAALLIEHADVVNLPEWNPETDREARALCVEAFMADLSRLAVERQIVLLIDGLDKMDDELRRWVVAQLVRRQAITEWQQRKLVVVIAGDDAQALVLGRLPKAQHECVEPVTGEEWGRDLLQEFLEANGFKDLTEKEVDVLHTLFQSGTQTLKSIKVIAESIRLGRT